MTANHHHHRARLLLPSRDAMRRAVEARDAAWDGRFIYGVVTTGVYCRPSCAARAARPENLRFFFDAEGARAAGFRACKRCRPDELERDLEALARSARFIAEHADEPLTLASLSRPLGLSSARYQKKFKAAFGVSPKQYQDAARLGRFKTALRQGDSVTGAIFSAGFGSTSRVYEGPARHIGMTPSAYRGGGAGETIYHAYRRSALGPLLLGATGQGVCFAQFGEGEAELLEQLKREFPRAALRPSPATEAPELDAWIDTLVAYLAERAPRPELPLDLRGTAFQLQVWQCLLSIEDGDVVSYRELADRLGKPRASRAVGTACAANRVGVLVPCHRVLRGDGGLGGYRWSVERKRALLDLERRAAARNA